MPTRTWLSRAKQQVEARLDPGAFQAGRQVPWETWGDPAAVSASRSLMITNLGVVEDPTRTRAACGQPSMGTWSFGYLMEQMANTPVTGVSGSEFARAWLDRWMSTQSVNGWDSDPRTPMQAEIIDPWVAASGGPGMPLDLSKAPFKLLAIVNRVDLRKQAAYGGGSGGELRFVFMHLRDGCVNSNSQPFDVILEFGVPASGCLSVKAWANQWKALEALSPGSSAYNTALEAITQQVVVANAASGRPNGSALSQIRTNETRLDQLGGLDWEVREFRIDPVSHLLVQHTLAQTPQRSLHSGPVPAQYVNANAIPILLGTHVVPLSYPAAGMPFRGASITYGAFSSTWDGPAATPMINREARHRFSLNTCTGCHYGETDTFSFQHVKVAPFGTEATLSDFLTGGFVNDPEDGMPTRYFDDLERRAVDMDALLNTSCFTIPLDLPLLAASH